MRVCEDNLKILSPHALLLFPNTHILCVYIFFKTSFNIKVILKVEENNLVWGLEPPLLLNANKHILKHPLHGTDSAQRTAKSLPERAQTLPAPHTSRRPTAPKNTRAVLFSIANGHRKRNQI